MSVLLMRLAGPMQAWGTQSRFSVRDTGLEPSKSGIVGLLCAALGKPRDESLRPDLPALADLANLAMAVRVDRPGTLAVDYHTAQDVIIASSEAGRKPKLKECEPSSRYYLADAEFLIALQGDERLLERIDAALADPVWPLCLGRKAFVPTMPIRAADGLLADVPLAGALKTAPWWRRTPRDRLDQPLRIMVEAPDDADAELRHDVPLCFRSRDRSFTARRVRDVELWPVPDHLIKEWPPCNSI